MEVKPGWAYHIHNVCPLRKAYQAWLWLTSDCHQQFDDSFEPYILQAWSVFRSNAFSLQSVGISRGSFAVMAAVTDIPGLGAETEKKQSKSGNMARYNEDVDSIREREFPMLQGKCEEKDCRTAG